MPKVLHRAVRFQVVPFGSYRLGVDARGRVNAMARELEFTVEQLVNEFGIDNVSDRVRDRVKAGDLSTTVKVPSVVVSTVNV